MRENLAQIQCPSCFEWFSFTLQHDEMAAENVEMDYDCEVCCRPMRVIVSQDEAYAIGMDD